jgi:hypothetical protein
MAEIAPQVYQSASFFHFTWPSFHPNNFGARPAFNFPHESEYSSYAVTTSLPETLVSILLLVISQLLIPSTAKFIVRLWPSLRENSIRVMLTLGWYVMMASMIVGPRGQLEEAWMAGFQRGWIENGGSKEELNGVWNGR